MIDNPLPLHPGKVLAEVYMAEMGLNQTDLARRCACSPRKFNEIMHGKRSITVNSALRIAKYFGTSPEFRLNLQTGYDLEEAAKEVDLRNIKEFKAA